MTFSVKLRGTPGRMIADYSCQHGTHEALVDRDAAGDPPDRHACPAGCEATLRIAAPRVKRMWKPVAAVKGGYEPPPTPYHQDLSAVADGRQTLGEWHEERARLWSDWRGDEVDKGTS